MNVQVVDEAQTPLTSGFAFQVQYLDATAESYHADVELAVGDVQRRVLGPAPGLATHQDAWSLCGDVALDTPPDRFLLLVTSVPLSGNAVAFSNPCYVRNSDGLPHVGIVRIGSGNIATLEANGRLQPVLVHEILHTLGFGNLWGPKGTPGFGLRKNFGPGTEPPDYDPEFVGLQAIAAFQGFNGGAAYTEVPIEDQFDVGSRDTHWRTSLFGHELMTVSITTTDPPFSRTTIASLADMGYQVNLAAADDFTLPTAAAAQLLDAPAVDLSGDVAPVIPRPSWP
jgi:hypothetical protein